MTFARQTKQTEQFERVVGEVFLFRDTCNVYALRDGKRAILIDFGAGRALDRLAEIGVETVDWVLHTHHHREQCQGDGALAARGIRLAVPAAEKALFADPARHWSNVRAQSVVGATFLRPLVTPVKVDRVLVDPDDFHWGPYTLRALATPGNAPGAMSFLLEMGRTRLCFSGDLMLAGGRLHNYYDSEWDYGYAAGITATAQSSRALAAEGPRLLCPSHGPVVPQARAALAGFARKMERFRDEMLLRQWERVPAGDASEPTPIAGVRRVSEHIFRLLNNTYFILADSGRALLVDCAVGGYGLDEADRCAWFDRKIEDMGQLFGLKALDAILVTHYHGDHLDMIPHAVEKYGAEVWCLGNMAEKLTHPDRFNLTCLITAYRVPFDSVPVHRTLRDGEVIRWEGLRLKVVHLPGQTEYAMGLAGDIDGRRVAFTGDNLYYSARRSGHDAFIARNSGILENGYIKCARTLLRLRPDLICAEHGFVIRDPAPQLRRFRRWAFDFRKVLRELNPYREYEYLIDPYWVSFYPYRSRATPGGTCEVQVSAANHRRRAAQVELRMVVPQGWGATPETLRLAAPPRGRAERPVTIHVPKSARVGGHGVTADIVLEGEHVGQLFDCLVEVNR